MLIAYKGVETGDSRIYMNENGMKIASIIKNNFFAFVIFFSAGHIKINTHARFSE